jgi:hypothetical protein
VGEKAQDGTIPRDATRRDGQTETDTCLQTEGHVLTDGGRDTCLQTEGHVLTDGGRDTCLQTERHVLTDGGTERQRADRA